MGLHYFEPARLALFLSSLSWIFLRKLCRFHHTLYNRNFDGLEIQGYLKQNILFTYRISVMHFFFVFWPFLSLHMYDRASRPYRLSYINELCINQFYEPKDQSMKFSWKNIENWRSWKMRFFWGGHFEFSKSAILNFFLLHISEKPSPFIWGIIFFCTMDGSSRILEKKGGGLLCTRL